MDIRNSTLFVGMQFDSSKVSDGEFFAPRADGGSVQEYMDKMRDRYGADAFPLNAEVTCG